MKTKININPRVARRVVLLVLLALITFLFGSVVVRSYGKGHILSNSTPTEKIEYIGEYSEYISSKPQEYPKNVNLNIKADEYSVEKTSGGFYLKEIDGKTALYTGEQGEATWLVTVPQAGFYNILLTYYPEEGGGSNIERGILVNGVLPFPSLSNVIFQRVWGDKTGFLSDIMGNDMKPIQIEKPEIRSSYVRDELGFVTEPYLIYFKAGENELTLVSRREPMSVISINISSGGELKSYAEMKELYNQNNYKEISNEFVHYVEGEDAIKRSSPTLYAISDRTSAYNSPADPVKIKFNAIGGLKWTVPGDWIAWEVEVPEDGLYRISLRAKQSETRGMYSTRRVYIDDEVPFQEAANSKFAYNSDWNIVTLGTEEEPFLFYLTKGKHTITMESTLGDYGSLINQVQEVINDLNSLYRSIIQKTTISPDPYQDYFLTEHLPHMLPTFEENAKTLRKVVDDLVRISGEKSDKTGTLERMALQLEGFVKNHRTIQKRLKDFNNNISALGSWILEVREQPLTVDWLMVHSSDYKLPKAYPNFFVKTWFGMRAFFQSFFFDYQSIGTTTQNENAPKIEVWFLTSDTAGREHANALRILIDETFTKDIQVDLKLVRPDVLLPATLAGRGPDVAINVSGGLPVNYSLRNAVYDVSKFSDFEEITTRFQPSAMVPFEFNGGYYALPNTQSFLVMFYRHDIFIERGWEVPQTWDDVKDLIPDLQKENLQFYLPVNTILANSVVNPIFASLLFQKGGTFYRNDNKESNFDSPEAMEAFDYWTDFYTSYKFPLAASFGNRFRSGETPIGIAGYEAYNVLSVFAPEIRGKWKFALIPGTKSVDEFGNEVINRQVGASGTAVMMMKQTQKPNEGWDFMKWWTSKETQLGYARELEAVLGPAARHNTPNIEAFKNLAWSVEERDILLEQWNQTVGIPEIAGGYYTGRNLENAFRQVVNQNKYPREILGDYVHKINLEITKKRIEFGLPVD